MTMIRLERSNGDEIWVNPKHVVMVTKPPKKDDDQDNSVIEYRTGFSDEVKGAPIVVARSLNRGLLR